MRDLDRRQQRKHRVLEDLGPAAEVLVGGDHQGGLLVGLADQPEQKVALLATDLQIAELIQDQGVVP